MKTIKKEVSGLISNVIKSNYKTDKEKMNVVHLSVDKNKSFLYSGNNEFRLKQLIPIYDVNENKTISFDLENNFLTKMKKDIEISILDTDITFSDNENQFSFHLKNDISEDFDSVDFVKLFETTNHQFSKYLKLIPFAIEKEGFDDSIKNIGIVIKNQTINFIGFSRYKYSKIEFDCQSDIDFYGYCSLKGFSVLPDILSKFSDDDNLEFYLSSNHEYLKILSDKFKIIFKILGKHFHNLKENTMKFSESRDVDFSQINTEKENAFISIEENSIPINSKLVKSLQKTLKNVKVSLLESFFKINENNFTFIGKIEK